MNKNQVLEIAAKLSEINSIFGVTQSPSAVLYQASLLEDLNFEQTVKALDSFMKTTKVARPPLPSQIISIVQPEADKRELAVIVARSIDRAIAKYGYNWSWGERVNGETYFLGSGKYHWTFKEAVIAELGEIAWHVICSRGGWEQIRNSANEMAEGQFIAQLREHVEAAYSLQSQGIDITAIDMPKKESIENTNVIALSASIKDMPK